MPKRKRPPYIPPSQTPAQALQSQQTAVSKRFVHGQKRLNQVLKTAKGFERQKLARRINVVRGDGGVAVDAVKSGGKTTDEIKGVVGGGSKSVEEIADKIARLEREVVVLKTVDVSALADAHLRKSIAKMKGASTAAAMPEDLLSGGRQGSSGVDKMEKSHDGQVEEALDSLARNNVVARLLNAKVVKMELGSILDGIARLLGLEEMRQRFTEVKVKQVKGDKPRVERSEEAGRISTKEPDWQGFDNPLPKTAHADPHHEGFDEEEGEEEYGYRDLDNRLASSSSSDDDDEEQDGDHRNGDKSDRVKKNTKHLHLQTTQAIPPCDHARGLSLSPSPSPSPSPSLSASPSPSLSTPQPSKPTKQLPKAQPAPKRHPHHQPPSKPGTSTFLPSLTLGGYYSGSDSNSDPDPDPDTDLAAPVRKNRRGQRARRQIWESKYGSKANHVKDEASKEGGLFSGWDPQRGAVAVGEQNRSARRRHAQMLGITRGPASSSSSHGRAPGFTGANMTTVGSRREATKSVLEKVDRESKPIHPSWAAAKKVKEMKKSALFAGKKVVFD